MKSLIESNTFQLAVLQAIVAVIMIFAGAFPSASWVGGLLIVKSLLDTYLRLKTTQPIGSVLPQ